MNTLLIYHFQKENSLKRRRFLCAHYKQSEIWEDLARWENMIYYLFYKKKLDEYQKQNPMKTSIGDLDLQVQVKGIISGLFGMGKKTDESSSDNTSRLNGIDETSIKLQVLDEINIYILHIDLSPELSSKILLNLAKKYH